jgi:hypothetical protein
LASAIVQASVSSARRKLTGGDQHVGVADQKHDQQLILHRVDRLDAARI